MKKFLSLLPLLSMLQQSCSAPREEVTSDVSFDAGEHVLLGDAGFESACRNRFSSICANNFKRLDGQTNFRYGELVAFSGDFYKTPEELYTETATSLLFLSYNRADWAKSTFVKEVKVIENFLHGHSDQSYPDYNIRFAVLYYPDYLQLALDNLSHFGFHNMKTYIEYHGIALNKAIAAREILAEDPIKAEKLLELALFYNGFADHFLTDGFASGHIRNPRGQILKWGESRERRVDTRAGGILAKILHDRDGEVRRSGEHGMDVTNAAGDEWLARCDTQLFWNNSMTSDSVQIPIKAVATSVQEVLDAFDTGKLPEGLYAATKLVPYPSSRERKITEMFSADMSDEQYDLIFSQMPFYQRFTLISGVSIPLLKDFAAALPQIMHEYRNDVRDTIASDPNYDLRLPQAYLSAYSNIQ